MSDVTYILGRIEDGDRQASEELLPLVYDELRKLAAARMQNERPDHTLQATALVHEAYVRLVDVDKVQKWDSRGHFFGAAAEAMRRILVDHARLKSRLKSGGQAQREELQAAANIPLPVPPEELLALNDALERLEAEHAEIAEIVKLRFFARFSMQEIANALGKSLRTVERDWRYARSWLFGEVSVEDATGV